MWHVSLKFEGQWYSAGCCHFEMTTEWIPSAFKRAAYKTFFCPQMTASEQQGVSNTLFGYLLPMRPKENLSEWMERETGDTMHTCPPSRLFPNLLPCDISSFPLFSSSSLAGKIIWLFQLLSHEQMAQTGVFPAPSSNKIKPQIPYPLSTNIFLPIFFSCPKISLVATDASHLCQFV